MTRSQLTKWAELLDIQIDRGLDIPIARQIYLQLRQSIVARTLPGGSRVPSSRQLSERLGVSRASVVTAYENLLSEGYIEGKKGSGTYIADDLPALGETGTTYRQIDKSDSSRRLSESGYRYQESVQDSVPLVDRPFSPGRCSVELPTLDAWRQLTISTAKSISTDVFGYGELFGRESLREVVAEYLRVFRSVKCTAEQVIITSGAQQAIDLSIRVLLNPGEAVWIENPGYHAVQTALRTANVISVPVPVDHGGLRVDAGLDKEPMPRAIFVTPSHQYPTGAVMPIERRYELLQAANKADAWIIEDDYDSEFRYAGHPLPSLQGLDQSARVIYVGTLSKVLFPGLRTGFLVVPTDLIQAYSGARFVTDRGPPIAYQNVLEEFMREGHFTSHIRRMRQRYRAVLDELIPCLRTALGPLAQVPTPECGMRFVVHLADGIDDSRVAEEAIRRGVVVRPISPMYLDGTRRSGLDIGFTGHDQKLMQIAAVRLGEALRIVAGHSLP